MKRLNEGFLGGFLKKLIEELYGRILGEFKKREF